MQFADKNLQLWGVQSGAQLKRQRAAVAMETAEQRLQVTALLANAHARALTCACARQVMHSREAEAVRAREAAEQALLEAQEEARGVGLLAAKKQREAERPPHFEKYSQYTPSQWLSTTGEIMGARAKVPKADVTKPLPRTGENGALQHWRRGLVGCVQDWAGGSLDNVVQLLMRLIAHFGVEDKISSELVGVCDLLPSLACGRMRCMRSPYPEIGCIALSPCSLQKKRDFAKKCSLLRRKSQNLTLRGALI